MEQIEPLLVRVKQRTHHTTPRTYNPGDWDSPIESVGHAGTLGPSERSAVPTPVVLYRNIGVKG